jgi:hypothetical protein
VDGETACAWVGVGLLCIGLEKEVIALTARRDGEERFKDGVFVIDAMFASERVAAVREDDTRSLCGFGGVVKDDAKIDIGSGAALGIGEVNARKEREDATRCITKVLYAAACDPYAEALRVSHHISPVSR